MLLSTLASGAVASAQGVDAQHGSFADVRVEGLAPSLTFTVTLHHILPPKVEEVGVYEVGGRDPDHVRFVARRVELSDRETAVSWADSRTCLALPMRLRALAQVTVSFMPPESPAPN